jgi:hypothetical protein
MIDIYIESRDRTHSELVSHTWPTGWKRVFQIINFNPQVLYDNSPNYWATEQLAYVLKRLETLQCAPFQFSWAFEMDDENVGLKDSIDALVNTFKECVDNNYIMRIY